MSKGGFWAAVRAGALVICVTPMLAGCGLGGFTNTKTKFSESEYGVKASPRVYHGKNVPKGGGRYVVGKPYKVAGRWFKPEFDPNYDETGEASWYGPNFHGRQTANGEYFDENGISAASPTLPLPSYVRVTNLANNRSLLVRVNDRGPFVSGRKIDLSKRAASMLGYANRGTTRVRIQYVGKAPLNGDDTRMLVASLNRPTPMEQGRRLPDNQRIVVAERAPVPAPAREQLEPMARPISDYRAPVYPHSPTRRAETRRSTVSVSPEGFNVVSHRETADNGGLGPLFYAAPEGFDSERAGHAIDSAFAAAEAMATRARELQSWRAGIDQRARRIDIQLGVFADAANAAKVVEAFSMIGAVDEDPVTAGDKPATRLVLSYLKPGATRTDVGELIQRLGLTGVILYD